MDMRHYFFDRVYGGRAEYDYRGRLCSTPEAARQMAELIALDLGMMDEGSWSGWAINVRNALGQKFFSIPVSEPDLIAA
jgi:hypothetical protein